MSDNENSTETPASASNGTSAPATVSADLTPAQKPPVVVDKNALRVSVLMSESDRWFPATVLNQMKWGGGEQVITVLGRIYETLRLEEVNLAKMPAQLSSKAEAFALSAVDAEMTINLICGTTGTAMAGVVGPLLAKLARRLRKMIDESVAAEKKRLETEASVPKPDGQQQAQ